MFNHEPAKLVLDPIIINESPNILNAVIINGTPTIIYKEDTVEYRAKDYVLKPNVTVDELLKKMEGVEVGSDGNVIYQGTQVQSIKLNGRTYAGGNVQSAVQSLPADIVEKVQFIDDFGNEAARTGIKDGPPNKVLNLTTKRERSVGNIGRLTSSGGNGDRYGFSIGGDRLNLNQQVNVNLNLNNTILGIANGQIDAGLSGGSNKNGGGLIGFRDQLGKKLNLNTSYSYKFSDNNSLLNSSSERYSAIIDNYGLVQNTTTFLTSETQSIQNAIANNFLLDLEYDLDSANFLRISPSVKLISTNADLFKNEAKTGFQHRTDIGRYYSKSRTPTVNGNLIYQHQFKKGGRNVALNINSEGFEPESTSDFDATIRLYQDNNIPLPDSLVRRIILNKNLRNTNSASLTFTEPLFVNAAMTKRLQFNVTINQRQYDNTRLADNFISGNRVTIDSLSNIYDYSFTTTRFGLNYNLRKRKYNGSLGLTLVPTVLSGTNRISATSIRSTNLAIIPIVNGQYKFSNTHSITFRYHGAPEEPRFEQLQPVRDETDPNNPKIGNPHLKVAFQHNISTNYSKFFPNILLNLYANLTETVNQNRVTVNILEYQNANQKNILIRETRYINLNGSHSLNANYGISKVINQRQYKLDLAGSIFYNRAVTMSNNILNIGQSTTFYERFGINVAPNGWLEINPHISLNSTKTRYSISSRDNFAKTFMINTDGKVNFLKTNVWTFSARKNFVTGINAHLTRNPFIINTSLETQFFKRKNGSLGIQGFDLLNQNNFITRQVSDNGFTDFRSNVLSRYFMVSFKWTPQKWTGARSKEGNPIKRRGDGSFIE